MGNNALSHVLVIDQMQSEWAGSTTESGDKVGIVGGGSMSFLLPLKYSSIRFIAIEVYIMWCCVIYSSSHLRPSSSKPPVAKKPSKTYTYTSQVAISPLDYQTVGEWLDGLKMGQYKTNFESRGISTTNEVLALDDEALKKMNIAVKGHISKIARSIALGNQKLGREPSMRI